MTRSQRILVFIAIPVVIAGAVVLYNQLSSKEKQPEAAVQPVRPAGGARAIPIEVHIADYERLEQGKDAMGTLLANEEVDVASEVAGQIEAISFEEGAWIQKGQVLAQINDDDLQAQRKRAVYQRDMISERLDRARVLLDRDAISREAFDQIETDYNVIQADIQLLEVRLEKTRITAPFDGVVGFRYVSPGSYVQPGQRIAHLVDNSRLKVEFSIAERFYSESLSGSWIDFTTQNDRRRRRAQIYAVDPVVDELTRTVVMRAIYDNAARDIVPGMFVQVVVGGRSGSSLQVPTQAIVPDATQKQVWVIRGGKACVQQVETGTRSEQMIEITSGLQQGDTVAVTGLLQLKEGAEVSF